MLGALAWAAGSWVRVAPPREEPVFVTLLAGAEEGRAEPVAPALPAKSPEPAAAPARAPSAPPAQQPASAPRPEPPAPARRIAKPAPTRAPGTPAPARGERASAPRPSEPSAGAAVPGGGPAGSGAAGAIVPGVDVARVYGQGEVDRAAAPVGGIRRPEYPARERMMGREGRVSLVVEVDAAGAVRGVRVARSGGDAFDAAARRAVEDTPFRPALRSDQPVASRVTVEVSFELE